MAIFRGADDLTNIAYIAGSPVVLSVNPASGVKTLADFVARARQSDKPMTYSSSGVGSMGQLVAEFFAQKAGMRIEHVPYKGASQGLTDLVGGHIAFSSQTVSSTAGQLHAGTLIGLAHTGKERMPDFPGVPTFNELGYPDLIGTTWFSLSGPAGLPADIVTKVNREVVREYGVMYTREHPHREGFYGISKRAVFVVDSDGVVRYAWITDDALVEPDLEEVLAALAAISPGR